MSQLRYRYPGVRPFDREQSDCFFGRDEEIARFLSLLLQEKLSVLYGKSGYGKSSLLNAGIQPRLEMEGTKGKRQYVSIPLRFLAAGGQDEDNLFEQFDFYLGQALRKAGASPATHFATELPNTLWGRFKRWQTDPNTVYVLLFDQFEELFSYPLEQQQMFRQQLAELLYTEYPQFLEENEEWFSSEEYEHLAEKTSVHAVLAIRADRLHELDRLKDQLPAILHKRFELRAMPRMEAEEALIAPATLSGDFVSPTFQFEASATHKILDFLKDLEGQIDPIQLQILAESFEQRSISEKIRSFDANSIGDLNAVIARYYSDKIYAIADPAERISVRHLCEEGLAQESDPPIRLSLHAAQIQQFFGIQQPLLDRLVNTRLLRAEAGRGGGVTYELPHDSLLGAVLAAKRARLEEDRKRAQELTAKSLEQSSADAANRTAWKKAEEEKRRRRNFQRSVIGWALILVALVTMVLAFRKTKQAESLLKAAKLMAIHKLPENFDALIPLDSLNCFHWDLESISPEIAKLQNLKSLDLSSNLMTSLPAEIGDLQNLQSLFLGYNKLRSLPAEIGNLSNLQALVLPNNQLSKLPNEIGKLQNLRWLDLRGNEFSSLPIETFKKMPNLKRIILKNRPGGIRLSESNLADLRAAIPWCTVVLEE